MSIALADHFDEDVLEAARRVVRAERVTDLKRSSGNIIRARVQNDTDKQFVQAIRFWLPSSDKPKGEIQGKCSCSIEMNCVHVAAVLLEMMKTSRVKRPAASGLEPGPWLSRLKRLNVVFEDRRGLRPGITHKVSTEKRTRDVILYLANIQDSKIRIETYMGAAPEWGRQTGKTARRFDVIKHLKEADGVPDFVCPADLDLLTRLATRHLLKGQHPINMDLPNLLRQTGEQDISLIRDLCATGRFLDHIAAETALIWSGETLRSDVGWVASPQGDERLTFFPGSSGRINIVRLEGQGFWLNASRGEIGPLEALPTPEFIRLVEDSPALNQEERAEVDQLFHIRQWGSPVSDPTDAERVARPAQHRRAHLRLSGLSAHKGRFWDNNRMTALLPTLRMRFSYDGVEVRPFDGSRPVLTEEGEKIFLERDQNWEAECLNRLLGAGAVPVGEVKNHTVTGVSDPQDLVFEAVGGGASSAVEFVFRTLPLLKKEGWQIEVTPTWPVREDKAKTRLYFETRKTNGVEFAGHGWFDLGFFVEIGSKRFNLAPLMTAFLMQVAGDRPMEDLLDGSRLREILEAEPIHVDRGDGFYTAVDLSPITEAVHLFLKNNFRDETLHPMESRYAAGVAEALSGSPVEFFDHAGILPLGQSLSALSMSSTPPTPVGVQADLRPYQALGAAWMDSLVSVGFGGLLADDMGLGKTLQILTLLQARRERGDASGPVLLVLPTSLLHGWQEQAARFTPDLRLLTLHGSDRSRHYDKVGGADLVLTTYQLLSNDLAFFRRREWALLVVDEAQNLKNPDSQLSRSIRNVPAAGRLALTGTPMENNLQDLWSLFDWINPGLLGDRKTFRTLFRTPIEKRGDAEAQARLNRRVSPFLLRRTKDAVAAELPPRTEIIDEVILEPAQKALYESVRSSMDKRVREAITARGLAGSQITILAALLKLRQVCCDPALAKSDEAREVKGSAKRERLLELLQELIAEGRRVLVFSQFVEMLNLIEKDLNRLGIDHLTLTGKSRNRPEILKAFKEGSAPVFLISLKAGGVGLNLTEADTVILYDPWWNPAVESQAMDRIHRIGQDKPVFVHRLVAAGTIEERMLSLQDRKRALADALLKEGADGAGLNLMDEEVLADLFAPLSR